MANIYDVAERAGVSHTTVARVMTGKGKVSEKTRLKVEAAAKALSYKPSAVASSLAKGLQHEIVIALSDHDDFNSNFYRLGALKAKEDFQQSSLSIEFVLLETADRAKLEASATKVLKDVKKRRCAALLLMPNFPFESAHVRSELSPSTRLVQLSLSNSPESTSIGLDQILSGSLCASFYRHLSHDDEVIVYYDSHQRGHIQDRCEGFKQEMETHACKVIQKNHRDPSKHDLVDIVLSDLEENPKLKGIMIPHVSADRAAEALKKSGRSDVLLVGFDVTEENLKMCEQGWIKYLIHQQPEVMTYEAVMQLGRCIHSEKVMNLKTPFLPVVLDPCLASRFVKTTEERFGMSLSSFDLD